MHALVIDNTIQAVASQPPTSARRLDTGEWVLGLRAAAVELQEACGYFQVTDTARPSDTPTTTFDNTVELVQGVPTVVWVERPKTSAEQAETAAATNHQTIEAAITAALVQLDAIINSPAIPAVPSGTMTAAQLSNEVRSLRNSAQQTRAAVQDIARTLKRTIRLVRGDFTGTD